MPTAPPLPLHHEVEGSGPRVVMAHGFTQTSRLWGSLDRALAREHEVVTVDMPGHGRSSAVSSSLVDGALQLGRVGGRAAYLGYSMGARFCLHLALARPDLVESLVLISATGGIDDPGERRARRRADEALAERLDPQTPGADRLSVDEFLDRWMAGPLFADLDPAAAGLDERRRNTGAGLASSLRRAGTGTQLPLWGMLHRLAMPVIVVCGGQDGKFTGVGQRLVAAIGDNATLAVVPGTGHSPHLQEPGAVAGLVRLHLDRVVPG